MILDEVRREQWSKAWLVDDYDVFMNLVDNVLIDPNGFLTMTCYIEMTYEPLQERSKEWLALV